MHFAGSSCQTSCRLATASGSAQPPEREHVPHAKSNPQNPSFPDRNINPPVKKARPARNPPLMTEFKKSLHFHYRKIIQAMQQYGDGKSGKQEDFFVFYFAKRKSHKIAYGSRAKRMQESG